MSDNDLIRRGDVSNTVQYHVTDDDDRNTLSRAIAALPAVTVGVPEATVYRAVLDWIRDDAGAAVKMSMTPDRANALTARILAALEPRPAPDAQAIREAALREAAAECNRHADWIEENGRQGIYSAEGCLRTSAGNILALIPKGGA